MLKKQFDEKTIATTILIAVSILLTISSGTAFFQILSENVTEMPEDGTNFTYEKNKQYNFTINWTNTLDEANITHNFTGEKKTETAMINNKTAFFEITDLTAGTYFWKMKIKDSENKSYNTSQYEVNIEKKEPVMELNISKEELDETEVIKIEGKVMEGENNITLLINNEINTTGEEVELKTKLEPGNYNITLRYGETQNYTLKEITKEVIVNEITFTINTNKEEYELGEEGTFTIKAPENATVNTTIYGPGCGSEKNLTNKTNELTGNVPTNKEGLYCLNSTLTYDDITRTKETSYEVKNNIEIKIKGDVVIELGDKTNLEASVDKGISPYTYNWYDLNDGLRGELDTASLITSGKSLKEEFDYGEQNLLLEVTDAEGNVKEKEITIEVLKKYELKVTVKDDDTKNNIRDAEVRINGELELTNSNGIAEIVIFEGTHELEVRHSNYYRDRSNKDIEGNKEVTIELEKRPVTTSSTNDKITIINPTNNEVLNNKIVDFEAEINPSSTAICKIYLSTETSDWYEELESYSVSNKETITYRKELQEGEHKWRVECEEESNSYSSNEINFEITTQTATSLDAGDIRQKLEDARSEINSLSYEDQKAANALQLSEVVRIALRDFDRNIRDINSMQNRRDLTQEQIQENIEKYRGNLEKLELETPNNIKTIETKTFIDYPKGEALTKIAEEYQEEKSITGNINPQRLEDLQNKIEVRTEIITAEIGYLSGETKEITIITKNINYKEETSRGQFLLEKIPSDFGVTAQDITFFQDAEIIRQNPLVRFDLEENITYYFEGHADIEKAEEVITIILAESTFTNTGQRNVFTGMVTGIQQTDIGAPIWSIIILTILLVAYLFHAFDIQKVVTNKLSGNKNKVHQLKLLINDSQDHIEAGDLERANLIFKEVKYNYENSSEIVRKEVYKEAMKLHNNINTAFVKSLLNNIVETVKNGSKEEAVNKYNMAIDYYEQLTNDAKKEVQEVLVEAQNLLSENE